ncbi:MULTISPECIES: helix-turn-helix transcriptional regulator [Streptomyces]|uniref:Helix-turn-helix transcriptional regulator n=1 Tax=Streptomyces edwardsiae TaxID=3075527 RepID=A0ABU2PQ25_9ACTN|nr:helix-turn-helix transcriptional regulator [Streptomyces sp. DSM 41636]MDT0394258.1 helix-turn-helix transcriptional regulator [Streptomyces sp. DSM 41636]
MTSPAHEGHGAEELCATGAALYERALREGGVSAPEAQQVPCTADLGLLQPAVDDPERWEPVTPLVALQRLLRRSAERVAEDRRREERLAETFASFLPYGTSAAAETPTLRLISGKDRIVRAIAEELAGAGDQLLAIHPREGHVGPPTPEYELALARDQAFLDRGGRIRTLYPHTLRHAPTVLARYERLTGDVEARTLDEVTERLILVDGAVAFVPANSDRSLALEVRHPALISYLATAFDRLWRLATPMHPLAARLPSPGPVTPRQHAIASLLVEGHTDAVIADRLGMNIRTAREHIAKLAAALGSNSRAQLGYLIARAGILDRAR